MADYSQADQFHANYVRPRPGGTLIVGSLIAEGRIDRRKLYPSGMAVGLDMQAGEGVDLVHDLEQPLDARFSHVDCVSVLEHCSRPWLVAHNLEEVMDVGATLFLSVPFIWRWHGYPSDYFRFTADGVRVLFPRIKWDHLRYAHKTLEKKPLLRQSKNGGYPLLPRTEVLGFGRRV